MCGDVFLRLAITEIISKTNVTEDLFNKYIEDIVDLFNVFLRKFVEYLEENEKFDNFINDKKLKDLIPRVYYIANDKRVKDRLKIDYTIEDILFHFPKLRDGLRKYNVVEGLSEKVESEYPQWSTISEEANELHNGFFEGQTTPLNQEWENAFRKLEANVSFIEYFSYKFSWNSVNNVRDSLIDILAAIQYRFSYMRNLSRIYEDNPIIFRKLSRDRDRQRYVSMFNERMPEASEWNKTLDNIVTHLQFTITSVWTIGSILSRYKQKCEEYGVERLKRQLEVFDLWGRIGDVKNKIKNCVSVFATCGDKYVLLMKLF